MTVPSQEQPDTTTVVSEGAAQSAPLVAQATVPEASQMEGDTARGSSGVVAVVERTSRRSPLALMSGAATRPRRASRCSSGWIPEIQLRPFSRSMMLPRA